MKKWLKNCVISMGMMGQTLSMCVKKNAQKEILDAKK